MIKGKLEFPTFMINCIFDKHRRWEDIMAYTRLILYNWMRRQKLCHEGMMHKNYTRLCNIFEGAFTIDLFLRVQSWETPTLLDGAESFHIRERHGINLQCRNAR